MSRQIIRILKWITCALILFGALVACSAEPNPVAIVATSTLIPSTATNTATPVTSSATIPATVTRNATATAVPHNLVPILESDLTPNMDLLTEIFDDLGQALSISMNRIQLLVIEEGMWSRRTLACDMDAIVPISVIADEPDREVAGFRIVLLVGNTLYEYHTESIDRFIRCPDAQQAQNDLLIAIDPVAADILRLVQRRIAEQLDLSTRRVQMVAISAVTWPDSSLGCPQSEQSYNETEFDGYRIVVSAGDDDYIFHSDSISIYPCTAEQEVLPELDN